MNCQVLRHKVLLISFSIFLFLIANRSRIRIYLHLNSFINISQTNLLQHLISFPIVKCLFRFIRDSLDSFLEIFLILFSFKILINVRIPIKKMFPEAFSFSETILFLNKHIITCQLIFCYVLSSFLFAYLSKLGSKIQRNVVNKTTKSFT